LRPSEQVRHEVEVAWVETGPCHCGKDESCVNCRAAKDLEDTMPPSRLSKR
jgi:hypothetical protein